VIPFEVHTLSGAERRMLLEMLASERSGEAALYVGEQPVREDTAATLVELWMSEWISSDAVAFTPYGRYVAEALVDRLVDRAEASVC
jgi:hypothetical protein